jgi:hypothetical protein
MSISIKTSSNRSRLLAGGARIHVDFHADRHFDDFRGFPGHLVLLVDRTNSVLPDKLVRNKKFASEILRRSSALFAALRRLHVILQSPVKPKPDQRVQSRPWQL